MLLDLIQKGLAFLQANVVLVGSVIAITQWIKVGVKNLNLPRVKSWMFTIIAFIVSALCIIPFKPVFDLDLVVQVIAVGGVATGLFKVVNDAGVPVIKA
jgi:hypothetical protein